ncbi:MAG: hypothetical protein KI793_30915 [Rivularia sp. (in: Bacteria)]|nr:hypothetical protein [Rivularia sp. MS3]
MTVRIPCPLTVVAFFGRNNGNCGVLYGYCGVLCLTATIRLSFRVFGYCWVLSEYCGVLLGYCMKGVDEIG